MDKQKKMNGWIESQQSICMDIMLMLKNISTDSLYTLGALISCKQLYFQILICLFCFCSRLIPPELVHTFALRTNASSNPDGCAERMSHLSQQQQQWLSGQAHYLCLPRLV